MLVTKQKKNSLIKELKSVVERVSEKEVIPRFMNASVNKKKDGSIYTDADLASHDFLIKKLPEIFHTPILSEEMESDIQENIMKSDEFWCIDPIDGTTNYYNGIPFFAISIAYIKDKKPIIGAVYNPISKEFFYAESGIGSYLNGTKLDLTKSFPKQNLKSCIAQVDFKRLNYNLKVALIQNPPYMSQRNFGASTLEWCFLAAGRFDLYLHGSQKIWDQAAGSLILKEAGGVFSSLDDNSDLLDNPFNKAVIASTNKNNFDDWLKWTKLNY